MAVWRIIREGKDQRSPREYLEGYYSSLDHWSSNSSPLVKICLTMHSTIGKEIYMNTYLKIFNLYTYITILTHCI